MTLAALLLIAAISLAAPPQRIVSTAPSATEMLYALGLGDRVVGVTTFCHYPPEAARKPKIGDYLHPSLEAIAGLRPDLVVSEASGVRHAERLSALDLNVLEIDDATLVGNADECLGYLHGSGTSEKIMIGEFSS